MINKQSNSEEPGLSYSTEQMSIYYLHGRERRLCGDSAHVSVVSCHLHISHITPGFSPTETNKIVI